MSDANKPKPPSITELAEMATTDLGCSYSVGRLQGLRERTAPGGKVNGLATEMLGRADPRPKAPRAYIGPSMPGPRPETQRSRDLTAGEATWITTLPTDPAKIEPRDAGALSAMSNEVRTEGDQRLVASRLDAVRTYHQNLTAVRSIEQRLHLRPRPKVPYLQADEHGHKSSHPHWTTWREIIGEAIRAEHPDLSRVEAEGRVLEILENSVAERRGDPLADKRRLADLLRATGTRSEVFPDAHTWRGEEA